MTQLDLTIPTTTSLNPMSSVVTVESTLGWNPDADEHRRAFIIENCAPYEWSIKDMQDLYLWLKGEKAIEPHKLKTVK